MFKALKTEILDGEVTSVYASSDYTLEDAQNALRNECRERRKVEGVKVTSNKLGMAALYPSGFIVTIQLVEV